MASKHSTPSASLPVRALAGSRRTFIGLALFSLFVSLLMLTGPLYMLQVYDRVLMSNSVPTLVALTGLVAALYLTLGILDWCRQSLFSVAASQIEGRLAEPVLDATFEQNMADAGRTSDQTLRDLRMVRRFIASPALPALFDAPFAPIFFAVIFMLHWVYGIWAMIGAAILVTLALINQLVNKRAIAEAESQERTAQGQAYELLRQSEVVSAMGMRERLRARWKTAFDASDLSMTRSGSSLSGFTSSTKAFRLLLQSGILGIGAYLSIKGASTPGAMIAASILMGRAIAPIEQTVGQWRNVANARSAWTNMKKALEGKGATSEPMQLPPIKGAVRFEGVVAAPPGMKTPVLKRLNFQMEAGTILGVIGPSASGKSTLARVVMGLWPPLAGTVRIDGAEVSAYPAATLGAQIGYLPQRVDLFAGSVRENIARFDPQAEPQAVLDAAMAANCHELILRLPDGYDTEIGQAGAYLSDGQRQRIGLARALYGSPALIILDEPNSNLDAEGDTALQNAIVGLKQRGASVLIIAHRPNAITHCDKLMVLTEGEIRLFGPRDEVLAKLQGQPGPDGTASRVSAIRRGDNANG
ncbi:MAG: type I secretion system permease/ATPase [Hyphomonadaceae bacterium]|nr:type I secretion system permease/ATPase [Hyphomonadaceae bacterium]